MMIRDERTGKQQSMQDRDVSDGLRVVQIIAQERPSPLLMREIAAHNEVNGFLFSAIECALIALAVLPFGMYYLLHARLIAGVAVVGIAANCLTITAIAVRSLRAGEREIGVSKWLSNSGRALIASSHPHITRDTLVVAAAMLVPFSVLSCFGYELARPMGHRG